MRSSSENVDLGDASVGVARNPLRDGAPPTGLCALAHRWGVRPRARGVSPRSPLPHFIEHRVQRWLDLDTARDSSLPPAGSASEKRSRTSAFVKMLQFYASKTLVRMRELSPRAASMRNACIAFPRVLAAGRVLPLASPIAFRRSESKRVPRHVMPLSTRRDHGILFARLVLPETFGQVETHGHRLQAEDSSTKGEHANALLQPFESEASSETGSFRRRAPVAASSSRARAANDSRHARATPLSRAPWSRLTPPSRRHASIAL
jgi:hypothetical protein